jgi:hypothetical protein
MTDKLDIIIDKLNRIEANTADAKADTAALRNAIDKALALLEAAIERSPEAKMEKLMGMEFSCYQTAKIEFWKLYRRDANAQELSLLRSRVRGA